MVRSGRSDVIIGSITVQRASVGRAAALRLTYPQTSAAAVQSVLHVRLARTGRKASAITRQYITTYII